jgi:protoheme IX farnesyltransferase
LESTLAKTKVGALVSVTREYIELIKPRISAMVVLTVLVAGFLSYTSGSLGAIVCAAIGVALVAASGSAWNQYLERYSDFLMPRTAKRPLPRQSLTAGQVAVFGAVTFGVGMAWLLTLVNWTAGMLGLATWILYVWVYTPLKPRTWWNTAVGAVAGAMPILVGAAACGWISPLAWLFFGVLFLWQFPHFMAIAWLYRADYAMGGLKMVTVVDPTGRLAGWHAMVTAIALFPATLATLLWLPGIVAGAIYGVAVVVLNAWYLVASVQFAREPGESSARRLMRVSLVYLPLYMLVLLTAYAIVWAR